MCPIENPVTGRRTKRLRKYRCACCSVDCVEKSVRGTLTVCARCYCGPRIRFIVSDCRGRSAWPGTHHKDGLACSHGAWVARGIHEKFEIVGCAIIIATKTGLSGRL